MFAKYPEGRDHIRPLCREATKVALNSVQSTQQILPPEYLVPDHFGFRPVLLTAFHFPIACQKLRDPGETISAMMFSLDGGSNYSIPTPVIAEYRSDHTYTYEVTGRDYPLKVRLDDAVLDDNYGQILIMIEEID